MQIVIKTSDAIAAFKNRVGLAKALGITKQAVSQWGNDVPRNTAPMILIIKPTIKHERIDQSA